MLKKILFTSLLLVNIQGSTTNTSFSEQKLVSKDKYGNAIYERDVTIETQDFHVKNYWKGFSLTGDTKKQSTYKTIRKSGTFEILVESTSACVLDDSLPAEGCSGQKPFLLNNEVLEHPVIGTDDKYEVVFTLAKDYSNSDQNGFYPLDIKRDTEYYKEDDTSTSTSSRQSFFSFFTARFDYLFSKTVGFGNDFFGQPDIADIKYNQRSDEAVDRRQRYISNIMAGVEKKYRMQMPISGHEATQLQAGSRLNDPISLLNYAEAKRITASEQCKFLFLELSSEGLMCRTMSGFGMDIWMPFFNKASIRTIETNRILEDTENSLLAMNAEIEKVPYFQDAGGTDNEQLNFLQNLLKPITSLAEYMKTMLFDSNKVKYVAEPLEKTYTYNEDKAMTLSFAITNDGTQIDDFQNFKLLAIRSVYADMIDSCTVKRVGAVLGLLGGWEKQFFIEVPDSKFGPEGMMSNTEWVQWCQKAAKSKGMFSYLSDWSSTEVFDPVNWLKSIINAVLEILLGTYKVTDLTSSVKHGLILDIKKVDLDPHSKLNRRTIKIKNVN